MGAGVSALERARRELAGMDPDERLAVLEGRGGLEPKHAAAVSSASGLWVSARGFVSGPAGGGNSVLLDIAST